MFKFRMEILIYSLQVIALNHQNVHPQESVSGKKQRVGLLIVIIGINIGLCVFAELDYLAFVF